MGVNIVCRDEEDVVLFDFTFAIERQSAQPCRYVTTAEGNAGWSGVIERDPDDETSYRLAASKPGLGGLVAKAACGAFDVSTLSWEIESNTFGDNGYACASLALEVG